MHYQPLTIFDHDAGKKFNAHENGVPNGVVVKLAGVT
jgi:hypothetical protein